ncbi:MAG: glycogen/starch/alpha-glucan phosphorylase [Ruminiclostridium sp.]|nr:glycogen/starch/alpha-glucan phosphorylase [Ruminiclostridium sp.]
MFNKEEFLKQFEKIISEEYGVAVSEATPQQIHFAVSCVVMRSISDNWAKSRQAHLNSRRACYFSMEFLVGRAIYNNLLCLGIEEEVEAALKEVGVDLADLEEIEDAALGNGGLGRLAACFLDSAATLDLPLDGYGIRYKYGLFKQSIKDGFQCEEADDWTRYGDPWSKRVNSDAVEVKYGDQTVIAVPYDMPSVAYGTDHISTLRLWQAEPVKEFDFDLFNAQKYDEAAREQRMAQDISRVLYPNDDTREGKILRLKQEYFFSSASVQDIVKKYKRGGGDMRRFYEKITIQLNDTHPVISIPELIRILVDEEGIDFFDALEIAKKTFNYTNHTIMAEALEKWSTDIMKEVVPRIYEIILQINEAFIGELFKAGKFKPEIDPMKIVAGDLIHMARMAIFCSTYVNGVAEIHTEILKTDALKDWYKLYPKKFQNKTNGITPRRWLALCNKELSALINELNKGTEWMTDLEQLQKLKWFADNKNELQRFMDIKHEKKVQLAAYIKEHEGVDIDPNSIFDIQIKRLHEYKRQLLNAFGILYIYYGIKDGSIKDFHPMTFIFGAKSAPGYRRAKAVIKYINEIGRIVNEDPDTRDLLKVVFVQNYRVSYAEKLVTAADVSEQISTAGTEASGTGNMKLMLNGTVTLGTLDGANVEIAQEAGKENNYIFGATVKDLESIMKIYDPRYTIEKDPKIGRVVRSLIDGTVSDGGSGDFRELYFSLLDGAHWHRADNYYVLGDLDSYVKAKLKLNKDYSDKFAFAKKCWMNMASAGKFSSDRTIADYAKEIWKIEKVAL